MAVVRPIREQPLFKKGNISPNVSFDRMLFSGSIPTDSLFNHARLALAVSILLAVLLAKAFRSKLKLSARGRPLPKVPGLPFGIGRFCGIPPSATQRAWLFDDLHKTYGPNYEWKCLGVNLSYIGTEKIANDLLVRRDSKHGHICHAPSLRGAGVDFRRQTDFMRIITKRSFQEKYSSYIADETKRTLKRMLEYPERWSENLLTHCARSAAACAWGDSKQGTKLFHVVPAFLQSVSAREQATDLFSRLPQLSLSSRAQADEMREKIIRDAFYNAQQNVMEHVASRTARESKLDQHEAAFAVGTSALMAMATGGSLLHTFVAAMCHYPQWMSQLQDEIDRVCDGCLPTLDDMPRLHVLRAVIKECLRWRPLMPLSFPFVTTEDEIYDGYFIPKGAIIHVNNYTISRDTAMYPHAAEFKPERWLDSSWPTYKEPLTEHPAIHDDAGFGFGVQRCSGIELAETELYTVISALVWAFDIKRKNEHEVPWYDTNDYMITTTRTFPCKITARSELKRRYIDGCCGCCGDSGVLVRERNKGIDCWDVFREPNGEFHWQGLMLPHSHYLDEIK